MLCEQFNVTIQMRMMSSCHAEALSELHAYNLQLLLAAQHKSMFAENLQIFN